ncbi:MAG: hypothetical protein J7530_02965 [Novosphingobium sp.]|nr:hypothetical protein [Novosphingobium sp.]
MFTMRNGALAAILTATMVVSMPAMAKSKSSINRTEDKLVAAGFVSKPANTPQRVAMLARLPANKFFKRVNGDNVSYVYADPKNCNCLLVGTEKAYGAYRATQEAARIASDQLEASRNYADPAWNWSAWGPWSGYWGRYGFGPRLGW